MKKIVILSIVCLVSGHIFAQSDVANSAKSTKVEPAKVSAAATPVSVVSTDLKATTPVTPTAVTAASKVKKVEPVAKTAALEKVTEAKAIPALTTADQTAPATLVPSPEPIKATAVKKGN